MSRREATVISQARGLSGHPVGRPLLRGGEQGLLDRVLGGVEVPVAPDERTEDLRRQAAEQVLGRIGHRWARYRGRSSADSTIGRTSATAVVRTCSGAGHADSRAAISVARSKLAHSTIQ